MLNDSIHTTLRNTKDFNLIREVVEKNIDSINHYDNKGFPPFRLALEYKHSIEVIDLLLKSGVKYYEPINYLEYVRIAIACRNTLEVIECVLKASKFNELYLHQILGDRLLFNYFYYELIELLLKYGAGKNIKKSKFEECIDSAQTRKVEYLLTRFYQQRFKTGYDPHRNRTVSSGGNLTVTGGSDMEVDSSSTTENKDVITGQSVHLDAIRFRCDGDMKVEGSLTLPNNWKINTTENELKFLKNDKEVFVVSDTPPNYEDVLCSEFDVLINLEENQRLRRVNGKVCIENRCFVSRTFSNDNRHRVYEDLKRLSDLAKTSEDFGKLKHAIKVLSETTYKNDSEWKCKAYELIQKKSLKK